LAESGIYGGWVSHENHSGKDNLVGFIVVRRAADELEVLNLAVAPECRRRGVAGLLLAEAVREGRDLGARSVWLEVRASNEIALKFYNARGFRVAGGRPKYYRNPDDDAVTLTAAIEP
jgi:ribosomal-protein-alanine N-acetyltransferase